MEKLEKEDFEPFLDSFYKTSSKVPKKVHKYHVKDEEYDMSYISVRERYNWDSNDDEKKDPKTSPHYHCDGGYSSET